MPDSVEVPEATKKTLMNVLKHAASEEKAVIEFQNDGGELYATEITEHVEKLEEMMNEESTQSE